jgi:hypothetical protein
MTFDLNTMETVTEENAMSCALDILLESDEYAEWVQLNAIDYGVTVCNGDTLIAAMEHEDIILAYLRHIKW